MNEYAPWIMTAVAIAGFGMNLIIQIRGGAWNAADRETRFNNTITAKIDESTKTNKDAVDKLRAETTANMASLNLDLDQARKESSDQHDDTMAKFGDTVAALRQKVNDDALIAEKRFSEIQRNMSDEALLAERTFMRRDDFNNWSETHNARIDTLDRKIDERFNRMDTLLIGRLIPAK